MRHARMRTTEHASRPRRSPAAALPVAKEASPQGVDVRAIALSFGLVLLVVATFWPCLDNEFVLRDDDRNFLNNRAYRGLGWPQLGWAWTTFHVGVYQPLAWMLLELQYTLWGLRPWGYHLTSLVLYAVATVVLFGLTRTLLQRAEDEGARRDEPVRWSLLLAAALAVALFSIHPLRVEVVAWASCQPYLPCALFSMLAVRAYLRAVPEQGSPRPVWMLASLGAFTLALLSKAVAVGLPVVLLILDVYPLRRFDQHREDGRGRGLMLRRVLIEKIPFFALSALFVGLAVAARTYGERFAPGEGAGGAMDHRGLDLWPRLAQAGYGIWFYLIKTLVPLDLSAYYPVPDRPGWNDPRFALAVLAAVLMTVVLWRLRHRWPALLAVFLSYLAIVSPNLGLIYVGDRLAADRYSYVATLGLVALLAAGGERAWQLGRRRWPAGAGPALPVAAVGLVLMAVLIPLTRNQCRSWRNSEALWTHALAHGAGRSPLVQNSLGGYLLLQGRREEARAHLEEALRLNPASSNAHTNLGGLLLQEGRLEEARSEFAEALRLNPDDASAHSNMALAYTQEGRHAEATPYYLRAVSLNPDNVDAHRALGWDLAREGRLEEAKLHLAAVLSIKPDDAQTLNKLGTVFDQQGRLDEARHRFEAALQANPDYGLAHYNLGLILLRQRHFEKAESHLSEAFRLLPDRGEMHRGLVEMHRNLAVNLERLGLIDEALAEYATVLRLEPADAAAENARAVLWATSPDPGRRDPPRAIAAATRACALSGGKNARYLATLAAAHAGAGEFASAVKRQTEALDLATEPAEQEEYRSRLMLYQNGQPYHEPPRPR